MHNAFNTDPVALTRQHVRVRGVVQGVGFRPFVLRLAEALDLAGWVRNDADGVEMEVQGLAGNMSALLARMVKEMPRLARIDAVETQPREPEPDDRGFTILPSHGGAVTTAIGPDAAVCEACLAEMFSPDDRRWRYPFINCTQCGPRYTITRALPYDRANTSMAGFVQCAACQAEYGASADRRFHAEANACPACGPHLMLQQADGVRVATHDPLAEVLLALLNGQVVALKGVGGFNLLCDARQPEAVARLRERKRRGDKPFAVMVANVASARRLARVDFDEASLLESVERPIVLLDMLRGTAEMLAGVAPGLARVGLMLPNCPLHYLLFHDESGRPSGIDWLAKAQPLALVVTSANPGGEPLVNTNEEALTRLAGLADLFLMHDRDIVVRCDDSVMHRVDRAPAFVRRARGHTPQAIRLAHKGPPVLAFGAQLKNTVCLTRGDEAFVSQHIGDLDTAATRAAMADAVRHLIHVLDCEPQWVACERHPDVHASLAAQAFADAHGVPCIEVQHHHAHIAAVLAEHGVDGPVLGLALDGFGLGDDGGAWGGELLQVDGAQYERLGHLRTLPLPGGDRAAREPWRVAAAALHVMGHGDQIATRFSDHSGAAKLDAMLRRGTRCPPSSGMGRWFDAVAGLLGVCEVMGYEGEAAMRLEALAQNYGSALPVPFGWLMSKDGSELDLLPLAASLMDARDAARGAAVFHATLVAALEAWVVAARQRTGITRVALGGGCFVNRVLTEGLVTRLRMRGMEVLHARQVPSGDGGLSLGQAWIAIQQVME